MILAAGAVLACTAILAQEPAPQVRIVDRVDESHLVTATGNTIPLARPQFDRGKVSDDMPLQDLMLVLKRSPEQQAAFDEFVLSQSDPTSPNYHQWLEPAEVGERFGPALSDIDVIEGWLRGHGFTVSEVSKDRMAIHFGGTAAQAESAFHTEIHNLNVNGKAHFSNMSNPQIPAALAPVVLGPKGLNNFKPHTLFRLGSKVKLNREKGGWERVRGSEDASTRQSSSRPAPLFGTTDTSGDVLEDVTPYDFAAIYNLLPMWNKGIDGTGETIGIVGTSQIDTADISSFRSQFGLPAIKSFKQVPANQYNPGQCATSNQSYCSIEDQIENSLDVEWSSAVAKGASIVLAYSGQNPSDSIDTIYSSANYLIENNVAPIINVSYGLCELFEGETGSKAYNTLWQTANAEGIAVFVAAGDSGSPSCDDGGDQGGQNLPYFAEYGLSVSATASSPYDTAVGGTDFNWGSTASPYWGSSNNATTKANALGYIPEVPWNATCTNPVFDNSSDIQSYLDQEYGYSGNNAEIICNLSAYDSNLAPYVDTVGGSGGLSNCILNSFNPSGTANPDPTTDCHGGWARPTWQSGVTGLSSTGARAVPDVSFFASSGFLGSAYLICESPGNAACSYSSTTEPVAQEVGGTSVASPAMAGVMALINQKAGYDQGNPNPGLYKLAAKQSYSSCSAETVKTTSSCYFNDIDTGTIAMPCDYGVNGDPRSANCFASQSTQAYGDDQIGILTGFGTTRGFDMASGLGSLNISNVVNAWPDEPIPVVTLSAASLTFPATLKGSASAAQTVTLKNSGHGALSLTGSSGGIKIAGTNPLSFLETNTCGTSVAIGASCTVKVTFKPELTGALKASLSIGDNAFGSPQTVALAGEGTASSVIKFSATSIAFGAIKVDGSAKHTLTLQNSGGLAIGVSGISITGTNKALFTQTNTCGKSLAAGKSCIVTLLFKPIALGAATADLNVADSAGGSPQKVVLTGSGAGPVMSFSPSSLKFPATTVGVAAPRQTITLTNKGNQKIDNPSGGVLITLVGENFLCFSETNTCGKSVAPGGKCSIAVTFKPRKTGSLAGQLKFTDDAGNTPQLVNLSGSGK
jgi:hypothetical protein